MDQKQPSEQISLSGESKMVKVKGRKHEKEVKLIKHNADNTKYISAYMSTGLR